MRGNVGSSRNFPTPSYLKLLFCQAQCDPTLYLSSVLYPLPILLVMLRLPHLLFSPFLPSSLLFPQMYVCAHCFCVSVTDVHLSCLTVFLSADISGEAFWCSLASSWMFTVKTESIWSFPLWRTLEAGYWQERKSSFSHKMYRRCLQGNKGSVCGEHIQRLSWPRLLWNRDSPSSSPQMKNRGWVQKSDNEPVLRWCRTGTKTIRTLNFNRVFISGSMMVKEILQSLIKGSPSWRRPGPGKTKGKQQHS